MRAVVAAPLVGQATADGADYLATQQRMWQANRAPSAAGRFARRAAARTARDATEAHHTTEDAVRQRWGDVPLNTNHRPHWAHSVANRQVDGDPRVIAAARDAAHAHQQLHDLTAHHADTRVALWQAISGGQRTSDLQARAAQWRACADQDRRSLAEIEALPVTQAAQLIHDRSEQAPAERIAVEAASQARAAEASRRQPPSPAHGRGLERGFGPSL